eukprot:m.193215 g.193215  ORF g.193215 m.193215 type:complete len:1171 (+) comp32496_c0_seq1:126-3638(+)
MGRKAKHRKPPSRLPTQILEPSLIKPTVQLSDELKTSLNRRNAYNEEAESTSMIMDDGSKRKAKQPTQEGPNKKRRSNKEVKRLKKIVEAKEKRANRSQLLEEISSHAIAPAQAELLLRSSTISSKMTTKQRLRQQLKEERAGIHVTADAEGASSKVNLSVPRTAPAVAELEESSDDFDPDDSADDTSEDEAETKDKTEDDSLKQKVVLLPRKLDSRPTAQELMRRKKVVPGARSVHVHVNRTEEVQLARLQLPILQEEHTIMETIKDNSVVIICGETGSGKTTQLPQFLYEGGYTRDSSSGPRGKDCLMVGVTEPRRIAAVSMAKRVAFELAVSPKEVSYQIRYQGTTSSATEIKFMTDGVLTKEIESDFALRKYGAVIIDEAHERSVHTDILLGLLSRIVPLRRKLAKESAEKQKTDKTVQLITPLKLIIMSATLRVDDFTQNPRLFPDIKIPVIKVDARQYPVGVHFSKKTTVDLDNVDAALKKISQIHRRLPGGGILVFLTGQTDIWDLCNRLKLKYPMVEPKPGAKPAAVPIKTHVDMIDPEAEFDGELSDTDDEEDAAVDKKGAKKKKMRGDGEADEDEEEVAMGPLVVLPLYSALSNKEQAKIFADVPDGHRLCVVATNVAETSLTIPGIRYVVDGGQVKNKHYDDLTGVTEYKTEWISQASAQQRSGRAGRTGPGHCYRLYSSAVFQHDFPQFSIPEIKQMPVDGLMLQMKAMNIDKVINFPFPTPPDHQALRAAEKLLVLLGALERVSKQITPLGKAMSRFPVSPRYGKMLCLAKHYNCLQHVIAIVGALTAKDIFARDVKVDLEAFENAELQGQEAITGQQKHRKAMHQWKLEGIAKGGDFGAMLCAVGACDFIQSKNEQNLEEFCESRSINYKAIVESQKLRKQLTQKGVLTFDGQEEETQFSDLDYEFEPLAPPTANQEDAMRQIILSGFGDCVAHVSDVVDKELAKHNVYAYKCNATDELVYIHPSSVLHKSRPDYVVYQELVQGKTKLYMKGLTVIQPEWLARLVPTACTFGKPLELPAPSYVVEKDDIRCCMVGLFGKHLWQLPAVEMSYPENDPDRYRYFARFLLDGQVFPKLAQFTEHLQNKPSILNKPWLKERVVALLQPLVNEKISTRAKLVAKWKENPKFLLQAYSLWLGSDHHSDLIQLWPPLEATDSK